MSRRIITVSRANDFGGFVSPFEKMELAECLKVILSWDYVQFDTEGTGLDCHIAKMLSYQFGSPDKEIQFVVDALTIKASEFNEVWATKLIVGQNLKYDVKMLMAVGCCPKKIYDTMTAEQLRYLAYPKGMYKVSLAAIMKRYFNIDMDKSVRGKIKYEGMTERVIRYAADDVLYLGDIMDKQVEYFKSIQSEKALEIEFGGVLAAAYFEYCGVRLNAKKWMEIYEKNYQDYLTALASLNQFVVDYGDGRFLTMDLFEGNSCNINWNSTDDVVPFLKALGFSVKGFNKKKKEETESKETKLIKKQKSVNPEFVKLYVEYSRLQKLVSTYGPQYVNSINPKTGRIHTEFRTLGCDTGRFACGSKKINEDLATLKKLPIKDNTDPKYRCCYPQIQNLPNTDEVRACFIAEEGNDFISIDYNSEESRLLASLSEDKGMLEVFEKGYDMHSYVAYLIYPDIIPRDTDIRTIKKDYHQQRQDAKGPEFTFAFLGNWATLVANQGMSKEEAQAIEKNYKEGFAGATAYQEMCKKRVENTGIVHICKETGHKAFWWDWKKWNRIQHSQEFWDEYRANKEAGLAKSEEAEEHFAARSKWDKNAVNSTTQGLGAVIFKHFSYRLLMWIIDNGYFNIVKFCVPVHDEICLECPKHLTKLIVEKTKYFMEDTGSLYCHLLPLPAQEEVGDYWKH